MSSTTDIVLSLDIVTPDPSIKRLTPADEILRLRDYLRISLRGVDGLSFVVVDEQQPAGSAAGLPWVRIDGAGRPVGLFILYNGNYVKVYDHPINGIIAFAGAPSLAAPPFYFCDGTSATPDLRAQMVAGDGTQNHGDTQSIYRMAYMQYKGYL